jgi:hypothetical protein
MIQQLQFSAYIQTNSRQGLKEIFSIIHISLEMETPNCPLTDECTHQNMVYT